MSLIFVRLAARAPDGSVPLCTCEKPDGIELTSAHACRCCCCRCCCAAGGRYFWHVPRGCTNMHANMSPHFSTRPGEPGRALEWHCMGDARLGLACRSMTDVHANTSPHFSTHRGGHSSSGERVRRQAIRLHYPDSLSHHVRMSALPQMARTPTCRQTITLQTHPSVLP